MIAEMRFERAERGDQYAGGGFLADPPPAPALPLRPFLQRLLPAEHMPQARPGRRGDAADRLNGAPHRAASGLDAQPRAVIFAAQPGLGDAQMRQIDGAQRVELRHRKARAEIFAGLRIPAVIEPRRSMTTSVSTAR